MNDIQRKGSETAIGGFNNEKEIAEKFNNWTKDKEAKDWLIIMGYKLDEIDSLKATILTGYKADINVLIIIKLKMASSIENIQVKLVSNKKGFNQVDKRYLQKYREMWNIPDNIYKLLAYFTGELKPYRNDVRDKRRMFISEFTQEEQEELKKWIDNNKLLIVTDILRGRGEFSAEWVLVAQKLSNNAKWTLQNINKIIQYYFDDGSVTISKRGSIKIGKITMQRKGGDAGRDSAKMLQFKIDPTELFSI